MKALSILALALVGCASTELELPENHPANARAPAPPLATSRVLRADYDPFANENESAAPAPAHHHHQHGKGAEK